MAGLLQLKHSGFEGWFRAYMPFASFSLKQLVQGSVVGGCGAYTQASTFRDLALEI